MEDNRTGEGSTQGRRTLADYNTFSGPLHFNSISRPRVNAANMEIKPALIHLVQNNQFQGLSHENPYNHLATFIEICNTVKIHDVPDEAIRLSLFPFSLVGNAKVWLNSFPENSFTAWEDVVAKFLNKYFPQSKVNKGKQEISSFQQDGSETLSQAWDRFKGLLRKTPTHGFDEPTVLNMFLGGLKSQTKLMLDASAGGNIRWKTPEEAHELIENMASNDNEVQNERAQLQQKGVFQLQSQDALLAQNKIMTQQLEALMNKLSQLPKELQNVSQAQHQGCELCGGDHINGQCAMQANFQEVNYMGNQDRQGNYNQGWRPHPSMGQGQAGPSNIPPQQQYQPHPSLSDRTSKLEDTLQQFMQVSISNYKSTEASIRNLEIQVGQLAKKLEEKPEKNFVANNEVNPKEECNVITTRSGKEVGVDYKKQLPNKENRSNEDEIQAHKEGKEKQLARFKQIFDQLEITMPLTEALQQIPAYAKYMKQILNKKKYLDEETIEVQGNCSAIMQKTLLPKFKDPGSFTIPCTIGDHDIGKALVDLGASINLMPLSMLKKIGDLEVKPTKMMLQLADRSIKYPYGVVEDVVVKIDKLQFPVDFVVMDMEEDAEIQLILGRPFMKTAKVVIHVEEGTVKLKDQDEEVTFNVFGVEQQNHEKETSIEATDEILSITSLTEKAAKLVKRSLSCLSPRVKGEEEEKEEELVHQNSVKASDEPKHGKPVKFKNRLWVIKNIKINGVLEIEAPYFRRVKLVTRKLLRGCWCHDKKMHCNIKNQT
ncbi:uncharacterized protein HKW66_Vig0139570 [Vigna angularis]|uniref:Retrotransposon gag domain-containing protein n=1 Tax=Phaseolus angularis TaxID=3914 RepID=A0A8T0KD86_PHAAN|nr:uncharacterized protein HKW66_Vig0139570 [Vigna angularis]